MSKNTEPTANDARAKFWILLTTSLVCSLIVLDSNIVAVSLSAIGQSLGAWCYEKFAEWTDTDGQPERELTKDEMLDDITLYWLTNTAASSARIYWEDNAHKTKASKVSIPAAVSRFPRETIPVPRSWAERAYPNLVYFNELKKGGHFAAWEQPELFAGEMRAAFRSLR